MLQRYNHIRINNVLKKGEIVEQKRKYSICKKLKEENTFSKDLTHKIVNKKGEETVIMFEEFLETATLNQLKIYKEKLKQLEEYYKYSQSSYQYLLTNMNIPLDKGKTLKLELKKKNNL